jgi:hypothetical protein
MVDEVPVRKAVDTAWAVYLATHRDVDAADRLSATCKGGSRPLKGLKNSRVRGSLISTGFPRTNGEADRNHNRTDSCGKREAELDVVRSFVLVFRDSGLGNAVPLIDQVTRSDRLT